MNVNELIRHREVEIRIEKVWGKDHEKDGVTAQVDNERQNY